MKFGEELVLLDVVLYCFVTGWLRLTTVLLSYLLTCLAPLFLLVAVVPAWSGLVGTPHRTALPSLPMSLALACTLPDLIELAALPLHAT